MQGVLLRQGKKIVLGETPLIPWASLKGCRAVVMHIKGLEETGDWLRRRLRAIGFDVDAPVSVEASSEDIARVLREMMARNDLIILVGGIRPGATPSLEGVAEVLGRELMVNDEAFEMVKDYYLFERGENMDDELPDEAKPLVMLPEGSLVLRNPRGVAPGVILEEEERHIVCLPESDLEAREMFEEEADPYIRHLAGVSLSVSFHIMTGEWSIEKLSRVIRILEEEKPWMFVQVKPNVFTREGRGVTVTVFACSAEELSEKLEKAEDSIRETLGRLNIRIIEKK